jgi:hypothetical protein
MWRLASRLLLVGCDDQSAWVNLLQRLSFTAATWQALTSRCQADEDVKSGL